MSIAFDLVVPKYHILDWFFLLLLHKEIRGKPQSVEDNAWLHLLLPKQEVGII